MAERVPLSVLYAETRQRLVDFVLSRPGDWERPAPATPGWTVHDLLAHLTGVAEDLAGGRVPALGPTGEWTAGHVARGRAVPVPELVEKWARLSGTIEEALDRRPVWPVVMDVGAHEHDVRGAVGDTGARDSAVVTIGTHVLLRGLDVPRPLTVRTEREEVRVGPEEGEPVRLTTTTFEAFRWRLGRRSPAQLAAMDWSADPTPFLGHLCVFGPARSDVVE
jgi:uncharacterized protein (TIGR03083 family)